MGDGSRLFLKCVFKYFWSILVAVLSGTYSLLIAVAVAKPEMTTQVIWIVIPVAVAFLTAVLIMISILVRLGLLSCKL